MIIRKAEPMKPTITNHKPNYKGIRYKLLSVKEELEQIAAEERRAGNNKAAIRLNSITHKCSRCIDLITDKIITQDSKMSSRIVKVIDSFSRLADDSKEPEPLQYVKTEKELKSLIPLIKSSYTNKSGLDKKSYCTALNEYRRNLLDTVRELEQALTEERRAGNYRAVPGYEIIIIQYKRHAQILADEITANNGTVDK